MGPNPLLSSDLFVGAISAFKAATLVVVEGGGLAFCGVDYGGTYGTHDVASCVTRSEHVPPHPGCGRGFHAWPDRDSAVKIVNNDWRAARAATYIRTLTDAAGIDPVDLDHDEAGTLHWLAGCDDTTVAGVAALLDRARRQGRP